MDEKKLLDQKLNELGTRMPGKSNNEASYIAWRSEVMLLLSNHYPLKLWSGITHFQKSQWLEAREDAIVDFCEKRLCDFNPEEGVLANFASSYVSNRRKSIYNKKIRIAFGRKSKSDSLKKSNTDEIAKAYEPQQVEDQTLDIENQHLEHDSALGKNETTDKKRGARKEKPGVETIVSINSFGHEENGSGIDIPAPPAKSPVQTAQAVQAMTAMILNFKFLFNSSTYNEERWQQYRMWFSEKTEYLLKTSNFETYNEADVLKALLVPYLAFYLREEIGNEACVSLRKIAQTPTKETLLCLGEVKEVKRSKDNWLLAEVPREFIRQKTGKTPPANSTISTSRLRYLKDLVGLLTSMEGVDSEELDAVETEVDKAYRRRVTK